MSHFWQMANHWGTFQEHSSARHQLSEEVKIVWWKRYGEPSLTWLRLNSHNGERFHIARFTIFQCCLLGSGGHPYAIVTNSSTTTKKKCHSIQRGLPYKSFGSTSKQNETLLSHSSVLQSSDTASTHPSSSVITARWHEIGIKQRAPCRYQVSLRDKVVLNLP